LNARVENSGEFGMGVWLQFGRGEVGWERRRRRNRGWKCQQMGVYNGFFRRNHRRIPSVGDFVGDAVGDIATSLYGNLSLNFSVLSVGNIAWRHHVVAYFQTKCIFRRWNRQILRRNYVRRYKYSVGNSVTFLRFSGSGCCNCSDHWEEPNIILQVFLVEFWLFLLEWVSSLFQIKYLCNIPSFRNCNYYCFFLVISLSFCFFFLNMFIIF